LDYELIRNWNIGRMDDTKFGVKGFKVRVYSTLLIDHFDTKIISIIGKRGRQLLLDNEVNQW
jgi:hypothetical protein